MLKTLLKVSCFIALPFLLAMLAVGAKVEAQEAGSLKLPDWKPVSQLFVKKTNITKPKFPVIDIYNHLGRINAADKILEQMDKAGVISVAGMDGHSKNYLYREDIRKAKTIPGNKILIFFAPGWSRIGEADFGINEAARLEEAVRLGARGVKVYKELGLTALCTLRYIKVLPDLTAGTIRRMVTQKWAALTFIEVAFC